MSLNFKDIEVAPSVELTDTPFFPQKKYQCGPAALATVLQFSDRNVVPQDLVSQVYLPEKKGSLQVEMAAVARRYERISYVIAPDLQALFAELLAGRPVLVLQNLGLNLYPVWHYAVVIGYESGGEKIILRSGIDYREIMPVKKFLESWQKSDYWGMVILRPGEFPAVADSDTYVKEIAALEVAEKTDAALLSYKAALQRWPRNEVALLGAGNVYFTHGQFYKAEKLYRRLLKVKPKHTVAFNNLALVLSEQGCYVEALTAIDMALKNESSNTDLREAFKDSKAKILKYQKYKPASKLTSGLNNEKHCVAIY